MIRWKRHRSCASAIRAFFNNSGDAAVEMDGVAFANGTTQGDYLKHARKRGMWAHVDFAECPPRVHFWHDGKRTVTELAFMLGHEVGHTLGKRTTGWPEEFRADEYGRAAALVASLLMSAPFEPPLEWHRGTPTEVEHA